MIRHSLALCAFLLLLAASACSSGKGSALSEIPADSPQASPAAIELPAPLDLLRNTSEPPMDHDRFVKGGYSYSPLPFNRYGVEGVVFETGVFEPAYSEPDNTTLSKAAYSGYVLANMSEYTGLAQIQTGWSVEPTDWANLYFAVANFDKNRWDWFQSDQAGKASLPGWSPYVSTDGYVYLTVLLLGTDACKLSWLVLGESVVNYVVLVNDLKSDPKLNLAPLTVNYTAVTDLYAGELVDYEWDFDNDGTPDVTGDTGGVQQYVYEQPGIYTCKVVAHINDGNSGSASRTFTVVDPANAAPVAHLTGDFSIGDAPLPVQLDASGSTDDDTIVKYEWDIDEDGEFEYTTEDPFLNFTFMRSGSTAVTVRVTDNDFATDTANFFIFLDSGWHTVEIDGDAVINRGMSLKVHGTGNLSRACLVYTDYVERACYFTRAITEAGHLWSTPKRPVDSADPVFDGVALSFRPTTGRPQIAYISQNEDFSENLNFVEALFDDGSFWGTPVVLGTENSYGDQFDMTTGSNGNPAIAVVTGNTGEAVIKYITAANVGGTTWNAPVVVGDSGGTGGIGGIRLLVDGGLPLISCFNGGIPYFFGCYSATTADGSAWDDFDRIAEVWSSPRSLIYVDGRPALATGVFGQSYAMYYVRANDTAGKSWPLEPQRLAEAPHGGEPALAIIDGVPTIAYSDWQLHALMYLTAADATGSAWNEPVVIDSINKVGGEVSLVNCNGNPVICYTDAVNDRVLAGSWY